MPTTKQQPFANAAASAGITNTNPNNNTSDAYKMLIEAMDISPLVKGMDPEEVKAMKVVYSYGTGFEILAALEQIQKADEAFLKGQEALEKQAQEESKKLQTVIDTANTYLHKMKFEKVALKENKARKKDEMETKKLEKLLKQM